MAESENIPVNNTDNNMKKTATFVKTNNTESLNVIQSGQMPPEYAFYSPDLNKKKVSNPGYAQESENYQQQLTNRATSSNSLGRFIMSPRRLDMNSARG